MEHIAAIMLLVGCNSGSLACEELPAPQVAFETMQDCLGALPAALGDAGVSKRIVHGRCAAVDPAWVEEDVEITWHLTRQNRLEVSVQTVSPPAEGLVIAENVHPVHPLAATH
ncbi:hypothetical protein [Shinella sp.]|uniref:hypothetical protein n=1 Tax=Shinella sp. TaxID=1870904 RepID=UPI00301DDBA8